MSVIVRNRRVGISAQKIRLVCNLIRNNFASDALKKLRFCEKKEVAITLTKLINSGLEIATNLEKYDLDNLLIKRITVDEGQTLKRIQPRAQGKAFRIKKRTGHITIELSEGIREENGTKSTSVRI